MSKPKRLAFQNPPWSESVCMGVKHDVRVFSASYPSKIVCTRTFPFHSAKTPIYHPMTPVFQSLDAYADVVDVRITSCWRNPAYHDGLVSGNKRPGGRKVHINDIMERAPLMIASFLNVKRRRFSVILVSFSASSSQSLQT